MLLHADYKWTLRGLGGAELEAAQRAVHQRSADRLQRLAFANGGIYIKIGQHIAQLVRSWPCSITWRMKPRLCATHTRHLWAERQ